MTSSRERIVAAVGAAAVIGGGVAASIAQRTAPTADFVSILGVKGRRGAWAYRLGQGVAAGACFYLGGSAVATARYRSEEWPDGGRCRWADVVLRRERRGAAMFVSGGLLAAIAAVPCSPTSPIPLVEGTDMGLRDWFHVPAAVGLFYLWPVAAHGWVRALLVVTLAPLVPLTMTDPHGPATAVLQRTMVVLAAVALLAWQPAFDPGVVATSTRGCRRQAP